MAEIISFHDHKNQFSPLSIATVLVTGDKIRQEKRNAKRLEMMEKAVEHIASSHWQLVDAIVFPGGYFFLDAFMGHRSFTEREKIIYNTAIHDGIMRMMDRLKRKSPNAFLIAGIDTKRPSAYEAGDNLCVAWDKEGIAGIGRKIFTSNGDSTAKAPMFSYSHDFSEPRRMITFRNGQKAVLLACYDMFGCGELPNQPSLRKNYIRYLHHAGSLVTRKDKTFEELLGDCITFWRQMLDDHQVRIGIAAIHGFEAPGRECYWQRHGIAVGSASLKSGLALGAAHYWECLPAADRATLAALNVPQSHLYGAQQRKAKQYLPIASLPIIEAGNNEMLIRLFQAKF